MTLLAINPTAAGYAWINKSIEPVLWHTLVIGSGSYANDGIGLRVRLESGNNSNKWEQCIRTFMSFDTSPITSGGVISAATLRITGTSKVNAIVDSFSIGVCSGSMNSPLAVVKQDYQLRGNTQYSDTITYEAFDAAGNNTFTINVAGRAAINKTGYTTLCLREILHDLADDLDPSNHDPVWSSEDALDIQFAGINSEAGVQPLLSVTYTTGGGGSTSSTGSFVGRRSIWLGL